MHVNFRHVSTVPGIVHQGQNRGDPIEQWKGIALDVYGASWVFCSLSSQTCLWVSVLVFLLDMEEASERFGRNLNLIEIEESGVVLGTEAWPGNLNDSWFYLVRRLLARRPLNSTF
ncbi:hypothetical protein Salat_2653700 [Sesamum alatum]|uniref:Uncharacterized protein n=1 Tax=Sesamum alatum TaxID=300844 RepID=A0AAE1XP38_9LAMI|nr:hypothetical protein Salat_2653700 [Sesamum alatum]